MTETSPALCAYPQHDTPREAEYGHLCAWCWQRLHADLIDAPQLVTHLRHIATPTAGARPLNHDPRRGDPAEQDLLSGAVDAADEIHANLASWVLLILEEHPERLNGPDRAGWWITHGRDDIDPDTGEAYTSDPRPAGTRDPAATGRLVTWLLPHMPWVARQDWAVDMRAEVSTLIRTTMARWPTAETRVRPVPDVPCPRCDHIALTYTPPAAYRAPFKVACSNPECGRVFTEDEWAALVFHVARAEKRAG